MISFPEARFTTGPLWVRDAPQAFPLVQMVFPGLELDAWQGFVARRIAAPEQGGVTGLRNPSGYFCALFGYDVRDALAIGRVLEVGLAVAIEVLDRRGAAAALLREVQATADRLACGSVRVVLGPGQRRLREWFEDDGYSVRDQLLSKPIA